MIEFNIDTMFSFTYPPNCKVSGFIHNTHELLYLLNGNGELDCIYQLIQQITENPCFSKSVREMAKYAGYSYDHFRHKFKKITGLPPSEYILNHRIENAASLLESEEYTCTEIAELCGFSSPSQFSVLFKKKWGYHQSNMREIWQNKRQCQRKMNRNNS